MDLITVVREADKQFKINVRGHDVLSDMSKQDGGRDAGMAPAELFAGSLGACIAMMVQEYCDAHGYADGDVAVNLAYELGDKPKRISSITVDVELPDGVPGEKIEVLRRVAELCPVHETLRTPPRIDVEFT